MKLARKWQKNVILSQFSSIPDTDASKLSCVWEERSNKKELYSHIKSDHEVKVSRKEATVQTANAPSSPLVPLQVRPTPITPVVRNATVKTSAAGSSNVDYFLVLSQHRQTPDFDFTILTTTSATSKILQVSSEVWTSDDSNSTNQTLRRPGPRLIWEIAWYVCLC